MKMEEYPNKMKQIADNLKLAGSPLPLSDLFSQILTGLDLEYIPVVITLLDKQELYWIQFETTLLTFENILEQIHNFQNLSINTASVNLTQGSKGNTDEKKKKTREEHLGEAEAKEDLEENKIQNPFTKFVESLDTLDQFAITDITNPIWAHHLKNNSKTQITLLLLVPIQLTWPRQIQ